MIGSTSRPRAPRRSRTTVAVVPLGRLPAGRTSGRLCRAGPAADPRRG